MSSLALDYQRTEHRQPTKILTGLDSGVNGFVGTWTRFHARSDSLKKEAEAIVALNSEWQPLSDRNLHDRLRDLGIQMRRHSYLEKPELYQALAGIREAAFRQVALKAFPVQLMGALALHRGCLAEMATGEGKTLTAGLAVVLAGWSGKPCHILTVNDYLVSRDMEWLRPLYRFCGVSVGNITSGMSPQDRQVQYERDVVYTTAKEVLADFLRDKLRVSELWQPTRRLIRRLLKSQSGRTSGIVMRGLHTVIVDEADSILIDEAVTPLIISAQKENPILHKAVTTASRIVEKFRLRVHYTKSIKYKEIDFTEQGLTELENSCKDLPGFWRGRDRRQELIRQALVAREFFHRDKQYLIDGDRVVIVDEFTGRPMPQRSWRQGLHQSIEAKEGIPLTHPTETIARLSFQRFFRMYHRISGMTETGSESTAEFWHIYRLPVVRIPTDKPCIRTVASDRVFVDEAAKWKAVVEEIERVHREGRPILAGARTVHASEHLAGLLRERGLEFQLLNAEKHRHEAEIIAQAGQQGRITIATNMAGRGTDIRLGKGVAQLGGVNK